ncbi:MAG: CRISPR-associated ring nuclease Csm6 [Desulfobacterales bacterium]|nr:CRISPR-associated ring nuclease Csm6 [Desulfobacterales bacterium]
MKRILLAVSGLSPAVITETIYALFMEKKPVDELHVITTGGGKGKLLETVLSPYEGKLQALIDEYEMPPIDYNPQTNLHVLKDANGKEINDILTPDDNEILLTKCLQLTHEMTTRKDTTVYFLVAGGRKTMTSCLALAAQFYGRPRDRIYHVLIAPSEVERAKSTKTNRSFWYPPKEKQKYSYTDFTDGKVRTINSKDIQVNLINLPYVPARYFLSEQLMDEVKQPADLLAGLIRDEKPALTISLSERKLIFGSMLEAELTHPTWLALYTFFAVKKQECILDESCDNCEKKICFLDFNEISSSDSDIQSIRQMILKKFEEIPDEFPSVYKSFKKEASFNPAKHKINEIILNAFGQSIAPALQISDAPIPLSARTGKRTKKFGILLDRERITIEWKADKEVGTE